MIAERDQDQVPELDALITLGVPILPIVTETVVGELRHRLQEWKPEGALEQEVRDVKGGLIKNGGRSQNGAWTRRRRRSGRSSSSRTSRWAR